MQLPLTSAIKLIDAKFGEGHAKAHPELITAWLQADAMARAHAIIEEISASIHISDAELYRAGGRFLIDNLTAVSAYRALRQKYTKDEKLQNMPQNLRREFLVELEKLQSAV